ncbi:MULTISPECIES: DNA-binding protein [Elizabethkingia]|uniref:DNA-binding protein n=1 Tax=Elizabethkingia TaxID=308865 RepID=UPI0009994BFA|nr:MULTISPECIES: DNA-binding protein [Elizabethkingia]MCT3923166.1 DNA-binding protein [Elizabethkingia anophelis]MCT4056637.1 DNA-binding protein [Elizabethkingia anophelis]MCT4062888.1 DNA-binding protein [Elizabethkingia anophelis]MCT4109179.1 DNA-binding protein [Elizabethkingia anophelis]MCT4329578.1 DNA-binding protein [Elizabethkingia anophelis]
MSNIKDRVLQIAEYKNISKELFFKELGLSYANFKGIQKKSALGSDAIDIILSKHNDISTEWLVLGKGDMLHNIATDLISTNTAKQNPLNENSLSIHEKMNVLINSVTELKEDIDDLKLTQKEFKKSQSLANEMILENLGISTITQNKKDTVLIKKSKKS